MQSKSEAVRTIIFKDRLTKANAHPTLRAINPFRKLKRGILLVSKNRLWASPLPRLVEECCAELVIASPLCATSEYVKNSGHAFVLLGPSTPSEYRRQVVSDLLGSRVSLFYAYAVEIDCWWIPALLYGENCHGSPASRASEFPLELKRLLQDPRTWACSISS